jgi:hypothetical protein
MAMMAETMSVPRESASRSRRKALAIFRRSMVGRSRHAGEKYLAPTLSIDSRIPISSILGSLSRSYGNSSINILSVSTSFRNWRANSVFPKAVSIAMTKSRLRIGIGGDVLP